jgi:uncharacterized protein (DUF427 family)
MTVEATWNGVVLASSDRTILVEGNHYFPPEDVADQYLEKSRTTTHCSWKGDASYYSVVVDHERNDDAAWYYPEPFEIASDIQNFVAFWNGVEVSGSNADTQELLAPGQ